MRSTGQRFSVWTRARKLDMRLLREGAYMATVAMVSITHGLNVNTVAITKEKSSTFPPRLAVSALVNLNQLNFSHPHNSHHLGRPPHHRRSRVFQTPRDPAFVKHSDQCQGGSERSISNFQTGEIIGRKRFCREADSPRLSPRSNNVCAIPRHGPRSTRCGQHDSDDSAFPTVTDKPANVAPLAKVEFFAAIQLVDVRRNAAILDRSAADSPFSPEKVGQVLSLFAPRGAPHVLSQTSSSTRVRPRSRPPSWASHASRCDFARGGNCWKLWPRRARCSYLATLLSDFHRPRSLTSARSL